MSGDISADMLSETALADNTNTLLCPIFSQPQGYPLEWHTVLNIFPFSPSPNLTLYIISASVLSFAATNYIREKPSRGLWLLFPGLFAETWIWSVKMGPSLWLIINDSKVVLVHRSCPTWETFPLLLLLTCADKKIHWMQYEHEIQCYI